MVTYAITNLPDMMTQFQAAAQGMVGEAVEKAASDAATQVMDGGEIPDEDGVKEQVVSEILNPANLFAMGQITGKILANMFKATLPSTNWVRFKSKHSP